MQNALCRILRAEHFLQSVPQTVCSAFGVVVVIAVLSCLVHADNPAVLIERNLERLLACALQVIILHTVYLYSKYKFKRNSVSGVFIII